MMILLLAGLRSLPRQPFEAAALDGVPASFVFFRITLPLLRPMTLVIITMTLLWELKIFDIVYAAAGPTGGTRGSVDVLSLQMFNYFVQGSYNLAAAVATLLTLLTLIATVFLFRRMVRS